MRDLLPEIWIEIVNWLDANSIIRLSQCSSKMRDLARPGIYRKVDLTRLDLRNTARCRQNARESTPRAAVTERILANSRSVRHLRMNSCSWFLAGSGLVNEFDDIILSNGRPATRDEIQSILNAQYTSYRLKLINCFENIVRLDISALIHTDLEFPELQSLLGSILSSCIKLQHFSLAIALYCNFRDHRDIKSYLESRSLDLKPHSAPLASLRSLNIFVMPPLYARLSDEGHVKVYRETFRDFLHILETLNSSMKKLRVLRMVLPDEVQRDAHPFRWDELPVLELPALEVLEVRHNGVLNPQFRLLYLDEKQFKKIRGIAVDCRWDMQLIAADEFISRFSSFTNLRHLHLKIHIDDVFEDPVALSQIEENMLAMIRNSLKMLPATVESVSFRIRQQEIFRGCSLKDTTSKYFIQRFPDGNLDVILSDKKLIPELVDLADWDSVIDDFNPAC